jgi:hypothetical protein
MRWLNSIAGAGLFMILAVGSAYGCYCGADASPCQGYGRSAAVFIGTPIALRTVEPKPGTSKESPEYWLPRIFKFTVEQSFLGVQPGELEVGTGMGSSDCGYDFKLGQRYVVYAYTAGKSDRLGTGTCSRTAPYEKADEDIQFLRTLASQNQGVSISGEVKRRLHDVAKGTSTEIGPLAAASLVVESDGERREVRTDAAGRYSLNGLRPGKYKVTLQLPDELIVYPAEHEITVADRGCATVSYQVIDNGRVSGKVLDPEGHAAKGLILGLMDANHADPKKDYGRMEQVDDEGRFSFSGLPPGRYLLAVNLSRFPHPNEPTNAYPRTYYPGVTDVSKAEVITLGAGENLNEINLRLPTRRAPSIINGKVVWDDGTPVINAMILFREVTYDDAQMNTANSEALLLGFLVQVDGSRAANDQGYFTISGYVGQTFAIAALSTRPDPNDPRRLEQPMVPKPPVQVVLAKPTEMVTIVLTKLR